MRHAIIADIHANLEALEAVLAALERQGSGELWCLGDIVGYGPDPQACLELVRRRATVVVAGNHDLAAAGSISDRDFNPSAAWAIRWTGQHLPAESRAYLAGLPLTAEKGPFTLVHGSARHPVWEYILTEEIARRSLPCFSTPHCLVGHSHRPLLFRATPGGRLRPLGPGEPVSLEGGRCIINPGAVGQPRDGDPRAAYAVYDDTTGTLTLYRVSYDVATTQAKMQAHGLPVGLRQRLGLGL